MVFVLFITSKVTDGSQVGKNFESFVKKLRLIKRGLSWERHLYLDGGTTYSGDRICFGRTYSGGKRSLAKKVADSYPRGKKVTVYYDPEDPKEAVLKTGFSWTTFMVFIGGLIFLCVGIACYISYRGGREESLHHSRTSPGS